jgi:hypothetical protein
MTAQMGIKSVKWESLSTGNSLNSFAALNAGFQSSLLSFPVDNGIHLKVLGFKLGVSMYHISTPIALEFS